MSYASGSEAYAWDSTWNGIRPRIDGVDVRVVGDCNTDDVACRIVLGNKNTSSGMDVDREELPADRTTPFGNPFLLS